jgi:hypothetical protein
MLGVMEETCELGLASKLFLDAEPIFLTQLTVEPVFAHLAGQAPPHAPGRKGGQGQCAEIVLANREPTARDRGRTDGQSRQLWKRVPSYMTRSICPSDGRWPMGINVDAFAGS